MDGCIDVDRPRATAAFDRLEENLSVLTLARVLGSLIFLMKFVCSVDEIFVLPTIGWRVIESRVDIEKYFKGGYADLLPKWEHTDSDQKDLLRLRPLLK